MLLTAIYGSNWQNIRLELWDELINTKYQHGHLPWIVARNFNVVRNTEEKIGGRKLSYRQLKDFNECLESCAFTDIRSTGGIWSLNNKVTGTRRITGRLDRVVCNEIWIATMPYTFYQYISQSTSDHSPMLLHILGSQRSIAKTFRYFNYRADCEGFKQLVEETWATPMYGQMQYQIARRLKKLK